MDTNAVSQIVSALSVVHAPKSTNDARREAQVFLERIKQEEELPFWGYQLALPDNGHDFIVRYFGLSLIYNSVSHKYALYDSQKAIAVRHWIVELANKLGDADPHYMKEKIADLWVSVAKRCWGNFLILAAAAGDDAAITISAQNAADGWSDMDANLLALWNNTKGTRELLLIIFRTLFEDIYLLDDPIAAKRSNVLPALCSEVVTSEEILNQHYEVNQNVRLCRASTEGWLHRWAEFLGVCLQGDAEDAETTGYIAKILETLKTCLHWVIPTMVRQENLLEKLSTGILMASTNIKVKTLATDCLHSLFTRVYSNPADFEAIVGSVFTTEGIRSLSQVFHAVEAPGETIDEQQYVFLKKLVEMVVSLSEHLNNASRANQLPKNADFESYLRLVLATTNHESVIVSGLSLQFWTSLLRIDDMSQKPEVQTILPELLECAGNRFLNYEDISDDHIAKRYLELDFDSHSDSHSFLSNYKRFIDDIVRITVCKQPEHGLAWLENRLNMFFSLEIGQKAMTSTKLTIHEDAYIYGFAQFSIIEALLKGISRWRIWYTTAEDKEQKQEQLNKQVESLGERLLALTINDPLTLRKQIQTLVQFAPLLKDTSSLVFRILERTLHVATYEYPGSISDEDKEIVRDLRTSCGTELNRLAYIMPESLRLILDDLENVIATILTSNKVSEHESVSFKSFLLIVALRSNIEDKHRRFAQIVDPEIAAWAAPETMKGLSDLHWFMERLGIVKIAEYFRSRNITANTNLLEAQMDERGRELRSELKSHWSSIFPIRATRIFVQYSIERIERGSDEFLDLLLLWKPRIQPILPHILQLMSQIQAYHNPENWKDLPEEVQSFVRYTTLERFWQEGISIQSKESFMDENVRAMHTLRDFADSVGHSIRYTREYVFLTIASISQLDDTFYEVPNIASLLWNAVAGDTSGVTMHSWRHMINLVLRNLVKNCPVSQVASFMGELLPLVLPQLDALLMQRWEKIYEIGLKLDGTEDDQALSEEMMEEHMLRQLTYVVDRFIIDLVGQLSSRCTLSDRQKAIRKLMFNEATILAPFLQLCCHLILVKDSKCCFNTVLVVRFIMDEVTLKDDEVDKYLCDHLMKALLSVLTDDYFADAHSEAAYALITLYVKLRSKSNYPLRVLSEQLPSLPSSKFAQFENTLATSSSLRLQRSALLELLATLKEKDEGSAKQQRKKELENASARRRKKNEDVMDDPYMENGALAALFDET
ncbi:hypothetical protein BABINDRAFT_60791 [Babjeviella inositovora NRRL Y-12698]|uniref:Exportin-5 C-terminal domain-containing protein n=1 Tax=Babjeviella inositovora NRRL Y-12698 TaxID=984486 RepID=A0A1E3QUV9_9ASCO|nr:uncharacterized protein BABINDRAFT_60791 [Babjeviella inositovora NRRL Y-12698]ODQ80737.1 hypothetical protein BABINDRAFT_60791 [Babjeviella inositovora NRRL Y-12698]